MILLNMQKGEIELGWGTLGRLDFDGCFLNPAELHSPYTSSCSDSKTIDTPIKVASRDHPPNPVADEPHCFRGRGAHRRGHIGQSAAAARAQLRRSR